MIINWDTVLKKYIPRYQNRLFSIQDKEIDLSNMGSTRSIFQFLYQDPGGILFFKGTSEILFFSNQKSFKKYDLDNISDYRQYYEIFHLLVAADERGVEEFNYAKFLTADIIQLRELARYLMNEGQQNAHLAG